MTLEASRVPLLKLEKAIHYWLQRCEKAQRRLTGRSVAPVGASDPGLFVLACRGSAVRGRAVPVRAAPREPRLRALRHGLRADVAAPGLALPHVEGRHASSREGCDVPGDHRVAMMPGRRGEETSLRRARSYGQQVPPLGQQKVSTSETQSNVQPKVGSQQLGSWAQTAATQGSLQPVVHSAGPAVQTV